MITYERSTLNEQRKVYWTRRSSSNDFGSGDGFPGQSDHGIHPGNQSLYASGILRGLHGSLFVTFEEGTWAAWLYDLLKPHVTDVLVCNPRKIPLQKQGNKSDKIDARKLAERLRLHDLKPVYHGENGVRMLRELAPFFWEQSARIFHRRCLRTGGSRRVIVRVLSVKTSRNQPKAAYSGEVK
jgi:hypothetical protein